MEVDDGTDEFLYLLQGRHTFVLVLIDFLQVVNESGNEQLFFGHHLHHIGKSQSGV